MVLVEGDLLLDGDKETLREIVEVCDRYGAALVVDDAHGSGTLGTHGRGILEDLGLEGRAPVVISTFSKVFGGIGGIILGSSDVVEHIQHTARSFVFSATLPVPIVAAAAEILTMLEEDGPALVAELHANAAYMRGQLTARGFDLGKSDTHIMPVMVRDERKAMMLHHLLYDRGVHMVPITYPGVKNGEERLRVNVTRGHTREEMDLALDALTELGTACEIRFNAQQGEEAPASP
ncbi:MAG: aminotransferase class I/II-fold pyridoxal phosphate-dependent enzyme [Polyangiales bacterium]